MRTLLLSAATQAILDRIKTYEWTLDVYGMSQSRAVRLVKARTEIRINKAGIGPPYNNVYRRYVLELVKTFRTRTRDPLAQAIPLVIRKWANLGLAVPLLEVRPETGDLGHAGPIWHSESVVLAPFHLTE